MKMIVLPTKLVEAWAASMASSSRYHSKTTSLPPSEFLLEMAESRVLRTPVRSDCRDMSMGSEVPASPAVDPPEAEVAEASCRPSPSEFHQILEVASSEASEAAVVAGDSEPVIANVLRDVLPFLPEEEARSLSDRSSPFPQFQRDRPFASDPAIDSPRRSTVGRPFRTVLLVRSASGPPSPP